MNCPRCGAALGDADLHSPNCRYCGAVHPHMARAAEKVEIVKQLLAPGPNGMPVAMAAMMGVHGAPPAGAAVVHSSVMMVNGVPVYQGGGPPLAGGPVGAYGAPPGHYASAQAMQAFTQQANQAVRAGFGWVLWSVVVMFVIMAIVGAIVLASI